MFTPTEVKQNFYLKLEKHFNNSNNNNIKGRKQMLNLRVLRPEDKVEGKAVFIFFSKLWLENTVYILVYILYS